VQQDATSRLLGEVSGRPLARWRDFVGDLPQDPMLRDVRASVQSLGAERAGHDAVGRGSRRCEEPGAAAATLEHLPGVTQSPVAVPAAGTGRGAGGVVRAPRRPRHRDQAERRQQDSRTRCSAQQAQLRSVCSACPSNGNGAGALLPIEKIRVIQAGTPGL
jgi:hypothetical protein